MSQREYNQTHVMDWVDHWEPYQKTLQELAADLGGQTFQKHWQLGKSLDFAALVNDLLELAGERQ